MQQQTVRGQERVSATEVIAAPAATVFAVLADPTTHASIDGTGWVQQAADRAPLTAAGQLFRMAMHHEQHPDGDYRTVNRVEVFDAPRAIGWITGQELGDGTLEFGGWLWRYDLVPLGGTAPDTDGETETEAATGTGAAAGTEAATEVTLSYDWSAVPQYVRDRGIQFPPFGPEHLGNSLHHLARLARTRTHTRIRTRTRTRTGLGLGQTRDAHM